MGNHRFMKIFRDSKGRPIVGKGSNYFSLQIRIAFQEGDGTNIWMVESPIVRGAYYCNVTESASYFLFVNGVLDTSISGNWGFWIQVVD